MRTIATSFLSIMQPLRTLTAFKVTSFDGVLLGFFGGDLFQSESFPVSQKYFKAL